MTKWSNLLVFAPQDLPATVFLTEIQYLIYSPLFPGIVLLLWPCQGNLRRTCWAVPACQVGRDSRISQQKFPSQPLPNEIFSSPNRPTLQTIQPSLQTSVCLQIKVFYLAAAAEHHPVGHYCASARPLSGHYDARLALQWGQLWPGFPLQCWSKFWRVLKDTDLVGDCFGSNASNIDYFA